MALIYLGESRPVFDVGGARMTYTIPAFVPVEIGDLLIVILVSDSSENSAFIFSPGWTQLASDSGTEGHVRVWATHVGPAEPATVDVTLFGVTLERVGSMLHFRGGGPIPGVIEAASFGDFTSTTTPSIPSTISEQASIQFAIATVETSSSLIGFTGWSTAESYVSTLLSTRRLAVLYRLVRTGVIAATVGSIVSPTVATVGFVWTGILRDRYPFEPAALVDLVAGNIGLIP